jgi:hypothetical protein
MQEASNTRLVRAYFKRDLSPRQMVSLAKAIRKSMAVARLFFLMAKKAYAKSGLPDPLA